MISSVFRAYVRKILAVLRFQRRWWSAEETYVPCRISILDGSRIISSATPWKLNRIFAFVAVVGSRKMNLRLEHQNIYGFSKFPAFWAQFCFENMNSINFVREVFFGKLLSYHNLIMACCENVFSIWKIFHQTAENPPFMLRTRARMFNLYAFHSNSISLRFKRLVINYNFPHPYQMRCRGIGVRMDRWFHQDTSFLRHPNVPQQTKWNSIDSRRVFIAFERLKAGASWSESWIIKAMITFWLGK